MTHAPARKPARVYTVAPDQPFLETLAAAILAGDLPVKGMAPPGPMALPRWTVLLPTRRAARALSEAFLKVSDGASMLLPAIRPLGDVDEDAALLAAPSGPASAGSDPLDLPPAMGALDRKLTLTRLVLAWSRASGGSYPQLTPGQAIHWAADLIALMDTAETEGVDLADLESLVADEFAGHWQLTLDFLKILTKLWPVHLDEHGLMAPYARRDALMRAETKRMRETPPAAPVIAAGSTGTVPATAELLATIARLDEGAVVLPGLDLALDEEGWKEAGEHAEHPQFGMKRLLDTMGVTREEVVTLGGAAAPGPRTRLVSELMRPAASTQHWRSYGGDGSAAEAVSNLTRIDAPSPQDEAEVIALILRKAAEEPPKTAALVTPDRVLARRVAAALEKWDIGIDDSAGKPLAQTPPGTFADLVIEAVSSDFDAIAIMALLKHPLTRLGRTPAAIRGAARVLELGALRRPFAGQGLEAMRKVLARSRTPEEDDFLHPVLRRIGTSDWDAAESLLGDLEAAFRPLAETFKSEASGTVRDFADAHVSVAQALAEDGGGTHGGLWRGEEGEMLSLFFAELLGLEGDKPAIRAGDYPEVFRALIAGHAVRPREARHPRLFIWGPLEARLQRPDIVILGGLNEDSWPMAAEAGPWLSRPMLEEIGLPSPERRIGLAAHDVAQLMGCGEVYLTRAEKAEGAPTVPSRWLLRLDAVLKAAGLEDAIRNPDWMHWAGMRDAVAPALPLPVPAPSPPIEARPKRLSVTRIEQWIANPYWIFAREILRLRKLDPLAQGRDVAMRGTLVHDVLNRFAQAHPEGLPNDIASELMRLAAHELEELSGDPVVRAFWQPQLARFARWFAETEPGRRAGVLRVHSELSGRLELPDLGFTLTARADRIDMGEDGSIAIYDYKTGAAPSANRVRDLKAPQLPLEAAIAAAGGFEGLDKLPTAALRYIRATGRGNDGEEFEAADDPAQLAEESVAMLRELIAAYADPGQPYRVQRRPGFANSAQYRYDDYAHLARVAEWSAASEGEG